MIRKLFAVAFLLFGPVSIFAKSDRPNIIFILADDLGYSDPGCYGGEIETPNLDRLPKGGPRFTQFYNASRCCPTHGSLFTGLYAHQAGIGNMMQDLDKDRYELNDLAAKNPAKTSALKKFYDTWASRCGVLPWAELKPY